MAAVGAEAARGRGGEVSNTIRAALERLLQQLAALRADPYSALQLEHAEREARAALAAEPVREGPSADDWDALVARAWDMYETVGYLGERLMYDGGFSNALDLVRKELTHWGRPTAPPAPPSPNYIDPEHQGDDLKPLETFYQACDAEGGTADEIHLRGIRAVLAAHPAAPPAPAPEVVEMVRRLHEINRPATPPAPEPGEVAELVAQLEEDGKRLIAVGYANESVKTRNIGIRVIRAATLLQQLSAPAPAVVAVAVSERLPDLSPQGSDFNDAGLLWWFKPRLGWRIGSRDALDCIPYPTHWLPFHAIPLPQGGEVQP